MIDQLLFQLCKYLYDNYRNTEELNGDYGPYIFEICKKNANENIDMSKSTLMIRDDGYSRYDKDYIPRMIELIRDTKLYDDNYIRNIIDKLEKFAHTSEV